MSQYLIALHPDTKKRLVKVQAKLMMTRGKRVTMNDTLEELLALWNSSKM